MHCDGDDSLEGGSELRLIYALREPERESREPVGKGIRVSMERDTFLAEVTVARVTDDFYHTLPSLSTAA